MKRLLWTVAAFALCAPAVLGAQPQTDRHRVQKSTTTTRITRTTTTVARPTRTTRTTTTVARPARGTRTTTMVERPARTTRTTTTVERPARVSSGSRNVYRIGHRPTTFHRIQAPTYNYPSGYSYRRWVVGSRIPRIFLSSPYYWTDWEALGLLPPPPGYVWVRYGPDLLLVNRYTGLIADVIYGAFY